MRNFLRINIIVLVFLCVSLPSFAGSLPYNIGHITDFLNNNSYFNTWESIDENDFSGEWRYTAIGYESGHINIAKENKTETDKSTTFTTADTSNFGIFDSVNFNTDNLFFQDSDGPINIALDPYSNNHYFELYRLTEDSESLSYLDNPITLVAGTLIVGFNDNGWLPDGDSDYDDIIIAMTQTNPVPEPATMFLLGTGLASLAGLKRRKK